MLFDSKRLREILDSRKRLNALQTPTHQDDDVKVEVSNTLEDTKDLMESFPIFQSGNFAIWNDFWNRVGVLGVDRNRYKSRFDRHQSRGRLLSIDYGYNIRYEFSLYHIGIVVADYPGIIVAVPVTTDRGQWKQYPSELRRAIIQVNSQHYPQFEHDSLLLVHQMRAVDKSRIRKDLGVSIARTQLMRDLEKRIAEIYCPFFTSNNKKEIDQLRKELENAKKIIEDLRHAYENVASTAEQQNTI